MVILKDLQMLWMLQAVWLFSIGQWKNTHSELVESAVYDDKKIAKLECVGHVQKRIGSRLRSLKKQIGKTRLKYGKHIGGKGRLTERKP